MQPPKQTHQPSPSRDETQWLSTLPRKLCSKRKLGNSHLLLHNQNSASCSSSWSPSTVSPQEELLWWQDFNKGAAFTRHSGTHHQQLEITPTLNKKGSDAPTRKFSWISSRRASPRPCSSLGNIGEAVPLRVYPQEHRPPTATPTAAPEPEVPEAVTWLSQLSTGAGSKFYKQGCSLLQGRI